MALQDTLGKMVGPLPLGAWVAIVGVAGGYGYWRSQNGGEAPVAEPQPDPYGDPEVGTGAVGGGTWIDVNPPATGVSNKPVDNDAWAQLAMTWFQANNYDMAKSGQAVANYLSGTLKTTDVTGWALVRTVQMHIGAPPMLIEQEQGVPTAPKPPVIVKKPPVVVKPKPKPAPSKKRYYTVRRGDSLTGIASRYKLKGGWRSIYNANRSKIKNPNVIQPGWKLLIPAS